MAEESKPVIVRVKRKLYQEPLGSFWLEVNERPLKKALRSFGGLSISGSAGKEEATSRTFLMQHVDTLENSETTGDALVSFLVGDGAADKRLKKMEERRNTVKQQKLKRDQLRSAALHKHEDMARTARFEQIWKSRKTGQQNDDSLCERYRVFDILRVDGEDEMLEDAKESEDIPLDDTDAAILSNYLPLVKEFLPSAVADIEKEIILKTGGYVYDIYTMDDDINESDNNDVQDHVLVQVDDDDYCSDDGLSGSDYDTDDSNAENGNLHDYPDEPSSESNEEQSEDEKDEYDDSDDGPQEPGETDRHRGTDSEYEGPIDMEEFEMEMEELRWRYL